VYWAWELTELVYVRLPEELFQVMVTCSPDVVPVIFISLQETESIDPLKTVLYNGHSSCRKRSDQHSELVFPLGVAMVLEEIIRVSGKYCDCVPVIYQVPGSPVPEPVLVKTPVSHPFWQ
jgi:hypothetical protein